MRAFLIFGVVLGFLALGWLTLVRGLDEPFARGMPQIAAGIAERAEAAVARAGLTHPITVRGDGRVISISGVVEAEAERNALVQAIGQDPLLVRLEADVRVLPRLVPYRFRAEAAPGERMTLSGAVPSAAARAEIHGAAPGATDLTTLATGVPSEAWVSGSAAGVAALGLLDAGTFQRDGTSAVFTARSSDSDAIDAARALIARVDPRGAWRVAIERTLPEGAAYTFSVARTGPVWSAAGFLPTGADAAEIRALAAERGGDRSGILAVAGAPSADWTASVRTAFAVLAHAVRGSVTLSASGAVADVSVATDAEAEAVGALVPGMWDLSLEVRNPTPPSVLDLTIEPGGMVSATGNLPQGLSVDALSESLPGLQISESVTTGGRAVVWSGLLDGIGIILPRLEHGRISIAGRTVALTGTLRQDFGAAGVRAALVSALAGDASGWTVTLDLAEQAPASDVRVSLGNGVAMIRGLLPAGLMPDAATAATGLSLGDEVLTTGGAGDPDDWLSALTLAGDLAGFSDDLFAHLAPGSLSVVATLKPGYASAFMHDRVGARAPAGWFLTTTFTETPAHDGDRRRDPETGEEQIFRQGFWLPDVHFPVSATTCAAESDRAIADGALHLPGETLEAERARLNHLAAIAIRCLNSSGLRLYIAVHTDSVGNDARNHSLSEARAEQIVAGLVARGVRPAALFAGGHGESAPVDTNNTPEGRARNARLDLFWLEPGDTLPLAIDEGPTQ